MLYCVIATEKSTDNRLSPAEVIISKIKNMPDFKNWKFQACHSEEELYQLPGKPDVIVISRYLSNDMESVFKHLPLSQPYSRFVVLAGTLNAKSKAFIKMSEEYGFTNIVTGVLPGDRPYTLLVALKKDKEVLFERETKNVTKVEVQENAKEVEELPEKKINSEEGTKDNIKTFTEQPAKTVAKRRFKLARNISDTNKKQNISVPDPTQDSLEPFLIYRDKSPVVTEVWSAKRNGILITSSANKGGVGKSTTAITLATALSKYKIKTCLIDLNLASSAIAGFYGITDVPGIEVLQDSLISKSTINNLLIKINDYLDVLPGTMDKSLPRFNKTQIAQIHNCLREMYDVVIADTPQQFWTYDYLEPVFENADLILAVVDQSKFSEKETSNYAPKYLWFGAEASKIRIVLNRYSSKLHNAKIVEKAFNHLLVDEVPKKSLPRVVLTIPNDWDKHVKASYKGEVILEENLAQWKPLLSEIANLAGCELDHGTTNKEKRGFFSGILAKLKGVK